MTGRGPAVARLLLGCGIAVAGALLSGVWAPAFILGSFAAPLAWVRAPAAQAAGLSAAFVLFGLIALGVSATLEDPRDGLWPIGLIIWLIMALAGTAFSLGVNAALTGWRGWRAEARGVARS